MVLRSANSSKKIFKTPQTPYCSVKSKEKDIYNYGKIIFVIYYYCNNLDYPYFFSENENTNESDCE